MKNDILHLQRHFVHGGYLEGHGVFYVALENDNAETADVTDEVKASWSDHWHSVNNDFENHLRADPDLAQFSNKLFQVWDGNHRLQAWMPIINNKHNDDLHWHFVVDCILLEVKSKVVDTLSILHDINLRNENSHIKQNLVHKLYLVQSVGQKPLVAFKDLLSEKEYKNMK